MNAEFRGFSKERKEWIHGDLCTGLGGAKYIMPQCYYGKVIDSDNLAFGGWVKVENESIGQKLKSTDVNGNKLFVGDICRLTNEDGELEDDLKVIENKGDFFAFGYSSMPVSAIIGIGFTIEVVGNIYQNPELLRRKIDS